MRIALLFLGLNAVLSMAIQDTSSKELAEYRLTVPLFKRFQQASRVISDVTRNDPTLAANPLFTREVMVLDDAGAAAAQLEKQLNAEPRFASAIRKSGMSVREYTRFAIALFGARLAHGFVKSGVLRRVPPGVATDNVAFVETHEKEIAEILQRLGVEAPVR